MDLTPEERRKIYEEEKARIEAEQAAETETPPPEPETSIGLAPNIAGLLCYLGVWITGIVFFVLEQKNTWVRFHAAQSIVAFGILTVASWLLGWIPYIGPVFSTIIGIVGFILWIVLMVKAYQSEKFKLAVAGDIAERMAAPSGTVPDLAEQPAPTGKEITPPASGITPEPEKAVKPITPAPRGHGGRITASAFAIAWSIILLIFFNFFRQYFAYYEVDTAGIGVIWMTYPFFTNEIVRWLPLLNTALAFSIIGHIVLIAYDRYLLRKTVMMAIDGLSLATVLTLLAIFPFDFSVIPNRAAEVATQAAVIFVLIGIAVGLGIAFLVRLIKLLVDIGRGKTSYG